MLWCALSRVSTTIVCFLQIGGVDVTLQVWDIGGQTIGGRMLENYIYGAHVRIVIQYHAHTNICMCHLNHPNSLAILID